MTRPGDWLGLAAAPTFAGMAVLSAAGGDPTAVLCGSGSPLGGMTTMYLLMSAFHASPWLSRIGRPQSTTR